MKGCALRLTPALNLRPNVRQQGLGSRTGPGRRALGERSGKTRGVFLRGMAWTPNQDMCEMSENYTGVGKFG